MFMMIIIDFLIFLLQSYKCFDFSEYLLIRSLIITESALINNNDSISCHWAFNWLNIFNYKNYEILHNSSKLPIPSYLYLKLSIMIFSTLFSCSSQKLRWWQPSRTNNEWFANSSRRLLRNARSQEPRTQYCARYWGHYVLNDIVLGKIMNFFIFV